jgi:hypothetical protein
VCGVFVFLSAGSNSYPHARGDGWEADF